VPTDVSQTEAGAATRPAAQAPGEAVAAAPHGRSRDRRVRLGAWAALAVAIAFYLVNALHFAQQPLRIEENEWPPMAQAITDEGRPLIQADESRKLRFNPDGGLDTADRNGTWHPPLYLYSLAAVMTVVGDDASYVLRGVGIAGLLLSVGLLLLIAREVVPRRWPVVGGAGAVLLLLHPYASQGSTFIDIDTSIYAPAILLALWLAIRATAVEHLSRRRLLAVAGALALVCWIKLTTAVVLLPVLLLWWLLARGPKRGIVEGGLAVAGGAVLFLATYALWCAVTGIAFRYTFDFTFAQKSDRLGGDTSVMESALHWHVAWMAPALVLLTAAYAIDAIRSFAATRRARPMDLLWGFGVAVLLAYVAVSPTSGYYQGKYAFPALAALVLPAAWLLLRRAAWPGLTAVGIALAVGIVAALATPDLLTGQAYEAGSGHRRVVILLGTAAALLLAWRLAPRSRPSAPGLALLVVAALFVAQSVRSYDADVSPMYPVQDTQDFNDSVDAINRVTKTGDIVFASKDTGFYVAGDRRIIEGQDALMRGDELTADVLRENDRVTVVSWNSFGPAIGPATMAVIDRCFQSAETFGQAVVRVRTGC
jgi:hypothetical protein